MEASTASASPSTYQLSVGGRLQAFANKYGLYVVLLALPVFYGIKDLSTDGNPAGVPDLIHAQQDVVTFSALTVQRADLLAFGVTGPLSIAATTFISQSRLGKAMRGTAQDPEAARLMGINVDTTISMTFLIGGMLAGAAGLIYSLYQTDAWFFQGFEAGLIAFTAAVMGGIGNLQGAVLGGLIIGFLQQLSDSRISASWTPAIVFVYLVLIMVVKPRGLLGEETREAG